MQLAKTIVAPSKRFAEHVATDYHVAPQRFRVVPNPIDTKRFLPAPPPTHRPSEPLALLFVSRMAVRKGVEMVVELSHRLSDLAGHVRLYAVGDRSLWSNYLPLLGGLNSEIAEHIGYVGVDRLPDLYRSADALLQPSRYEPFALTVGEALASGIPVVASSEVGAAEDVAPECCLVFPSGDVNAFEAAVRKLIDHLRNEARATVSELARREAERLFSPEVVAAQVASVLEEAAA